MCFHFRLTCQPTIKLWYSRRFRSANFKTARSCHYLIWSLMLQIHHNFKIYISPRYNWKIVENGVKHHKPIYCDRYWLLKWLNIVIFLNTGTNNFQEVIFDKGPYNGVGRYFLKPFKHWNTILTGMFLWWSSAKIRFIVSTRNLIWLNPKCTWMTIRRSFANLMCRLKIQYGHHLSIWFIFS